MDNAMSLQAQIRDLERKLVEAKAQAQAKFLLDGTVLTVTIPGIDPANPPAGVMPSEFGNFTLWQSGTTRYTRGVKIAETETYTLKFDGRVYLVPKRDAYLAK